MAEPLYDLIKITYDENEQAIKDNITKAQERELIVALDTACIYQKLGNKLFKYVPIEVI